MIGAGVAERITVVGLGNPFRRDDGAGPAAVRLLREKLPRHVEVDEQDGEPLRLLDVWEGAALAVVVDAIRSGTDPPGRVVRLDYGPSTGLRAGRCVSFHGAAAGQAVELARVLGRLPRRLIVFGIVGRDFEFGLGLSSEVQASLTTVVDSVVELVLLSAARPPSPEGGLQGPEGRSL